MRYRIGIAIAVSLLAFGSAASADMIVDGSFSTGFVGGAGTLGGSSADIGGDGLVIDDGWVLDADGTWVCADGAASRTTTTKYGSHGFGQIVSNTEVAAGGVLTFAFDYVVGTLNSEFVGYVLYAITDDNGGAPWLIYNGDGVSLQGLDLDGGPEPAGNYTFTELVGDSFPGGVSGTFSQDIPMTADYDYFLVAFSADNDDSKGVWISNVSLIPEPATMGLLALGALAALRRRRDA